MQKRIASKGWLWARALYLLFAVVLYWLSCVNWNAYLYGTVFVMAPWAVLLTAGGIARGQVRRSAYNVLLFAAAAIYTLAALRNGNLTPRGLLVLALGFAAVWLGVRGFGGVGGARSRRGLYRLGFSVAALALAVLLFAAISRFFGHEEWLPWVTKKVASRGARSANNGAMLLRSQNRTLKGLTVLTYACGAMLVAGIVPAEADAAYLRRESRLLCLVVAALGLAYLAPAVSTVFTGEPIWDPSWMPSVVGIQSKGFITDRIWALQHPNKAAMSAVMGIFCALYGLGGLKKRWARALLVPVVIVYLMALAHCQSRTSDIALGLGAGALAFRAAWLRLAGRRRWIAGLAAWGVTLALTVLLVSGVFTVDIMAATRLGASAESNLLESMRENAAGKRAADRQETEASDSAVEVSDGVVVSRTVSAGMLDVFSNGRDAVWREGLDYLIHHPGDLLLGMGSGDILERMKAYNPERYNASHLHNGFLEALARGGVFMLLALVGALCLLAGPAARALVSPDGDDPGMPVLAALLGVLLAISLVEALLFTDATTYNLLFFCAAGRVMRARGNA